MITFTVTSISHSHDHMIYEEDEKDKRLWVGGGPLQLLRIILATGGIAGQGGGGDPPVWFQRGATRKGDLTGQNEEERGEGGKKG